MKQTTLLIAFLTSCGTTGPIGNGSGLYTPSGDTSTKLYWERNASGLLEKDVRLFKNQVFLCAAAHHLKVLG